VQEPQLERLFPLTALMEEFHYSRQHLLRLEREGQIPPFLRRHKHCRVYGTEQHRLALAGRLGLTAA
jgi:hypothetical protein